MRNISAALRRSSRASCGWKSSGSGRDSRMKPSSACLGDKLMRTGWQGLADQTSPRAAVDYEGVESRRSLRNGHVLLNGSAQALFVLGGSRFSKIAFAPDHQRCRDEPVMKLVARPSSQRI